MKKYNKLLLLAVILISLFGLLMIYSSSNIWAEYKYNDPYKYLKSQAIFLIIGYILMIIISKFPYQNYKKLANIIFLTCTIMLILVLIPGIGTVRNGSRSWFGIGSLGLQPSEFTKLGLIILLIVLIVIIAGTLGYYFMFYTNPVNTYKRLLDDATKEAMVALKEANTEKAEIETKLKANIELKDETVDQKIIDLINKTDIISTIQFDKENKQMTVKLDANYDSKDLLDIELFNDSKNKKTY